MKKQRIRWSLAGFGLLAALAAAEANERRFAYTYESGVLPPGVKEVEPWATWRTGRDHFYSRFDYRLEYEVGLTDRLLTALYVNWHRATEEDPAHPGQTVNDQEFEGISSEWKYKLLDPVANPVGLALYQEYGFHSDEIEWESKLILDKKIGDTLIACNAVVEPEWEFDPEATEYTLNLENDLGVTHFFTPAFSAGVEAVNQNKKTRASRGLAYSAFFMGPVVSYARDNWWLTLTVLRQLPALKRSVPENSLILDDLEKFNVRILASIRI